MENQSAKHSNNSSETFGGPEIIEATENTALEERERFYHAPGDHSKTTEDRRREEKEEEETAWKLHVEVLKNMETVRTAFDGMMPYLPYWIAYWKKLSDMKATHSDEDRWSNSNSLSYSNPPLSLYPPFSEDIPGPSTIPPGEISTPGDSTRLTTGGIQEQGVAGLPTHTYSYNQRHLEAGASIAKEKRSLECQECNKLFRYKSDLETHSLTHTGVRNFGCGECGKKFSRKSHLNAHIKTHSGVRDYECLACGKRFARNSALTEHSLTHSSVKNYVCAECGKRFTTSSNLNQHLLRHTDTKDFKCEVCGKRFKTRKDIMKHTTIHI